MNKTHMTHCPTCGQHLRLCPVCRNEVLPRLGDPSRDIDEHDDKVGHDCAGQGLAYKLTLNPAGMR
jgi:hypothetical protein